MELVKLTHENMEKEHICCAISNNKDIQVMSKKNWLKDRLDEGLVFLKGNVRGNASLSIFLRNTHGRPSRRRAGIRKKEMYWMVMKEGLYQGGMAAGVTGKAL